MTKDWDKVLKWLSTLSEKQYAAYLKDLEHFCEPQIPSLTFQPELVDYSTRGPGDYVISGPFGRNKKGRGRWFPSAQKALEWAKGKYGESRVQQIKNSALSEGLRWAVLIKAV